MVHDLCFMVLAMLLGFAPALALALWRLWSRTRPRVLSFSQRDPSMLIPLLDQRLAPVGLKRTSGSALPAVYEPKTLRRARGLAPVTADWRAPDRATLTGTNRVVSRAGRGLPGAQLEASSATWLFRRPVKAAVASYLGAMGLLALTLGGLRAYQFSQRRSDGASPDDVQITLVLAPPETRHPLERNVLVEQTGRYVFITAPAGLKDGERLRFPRRGRANGLLGAGDLEVVIRVK